MPISRQWLFSATWLPKQVKQISAIEQGKLLSADLGRDFLEAEGKGYDKCVIGKNWAKGMSGNFNLFNPQYQARPQSASRMLEAAEPPVEKRP